MTATEKKLEQTATNSRDQDSGCGSVGREIVVRGFRAMAVEGTLDSSTNARVPVSAGNAETDRAKRGQFTSAQRSQKVPECRSN